MKYTMARLAAELVAAGETVSAGSFESDRTIYVCSRRCVPGTFGHPALSATYDKMTGNVSRVGDWPARVEVKQ